MLKKFVISLLCLFMLVGCSSTSSLDLNKTADELYNSLGFKATELSFEQAQGILFFGDEVVDAKVYLANDNTSSIVAVIESNDVNKTEETLLAYKNQLVNMANAYSPEELEVIENSYLASNDKYIIFVINSLVDSVSDIANKSLGIN